jgi:hypothetical protein
MDNLPSEIQEMIQRWTCEFNRVDAIERLGVFQDQYAESMRSIVSDISHNVPMYVFRILTHSHRSLSISLLLPACDPHKVDLRHRIPESYLVSYTRSSLTLPRDFVRLLE